jgi:hypothetical protein
MLADNFVHLKGKRPWLLREGTPSVFVYAATIAKGGCMVEFQDTAPAKRGWVRHLNALGLVLGMVGVVLIFIWGPPQPSFEQSVAIGLEAPTVLADGKTVAQYDEVVAANKQLYKRMSQIGLALIFVGFGCQLFATMRRAPSS